MGAGTAKRMAVNPNNHAQMLVLWSNGRIVPLGGALDPMAGANPPPTFYAAADSKGPAVAFQVIDWSVMSGYTCDYFGGIAAWGPSGATPPFPNSAPYISPLSLVVDFVMNPVGNGQGYQLWTDGSLHEFDGATSRGAGASYPVMIAKRLAMQYATGRGYILDGYGGRAPLPGSPAIPGNPYWSGWDIARALAITDFVAGKGYLMSGWGDISTVGGGQLAVGGPYWPNWDIARDLVVIDDGLNAAFPLKLAVLDGQGKVHVFISSRAPAVYVGGQTTPTPSDPTTTTTRPRLLWDYKDPESDAQINAEVIIFPEAATNVFNDEMQRITFSGNPTGGVFQLGFGGERTANISFSATPATLATSIMTALDALWGVPTNNIVCSGVAGGGGPVITLTFGAKLGRANQPIVTLEKNALTGGASPGFAMSTIGQGTDPWSMGLAAIVNWSTIDTSRRFYDVPFDLTNGTYRAFMRVTDAAGLVSPVGNRAWTQNVAVAATAGPSMTAVSLDGLAGIMLSPTFTNPATGAQYVIEYSDNYNALDPTTATWLEVRYATSSAVPGVVNAGAAGWRDPAVSWRDALVNWRGSGGGTGGVGGTVGTSGDQVLDLEARFGKTRAYRCRVYTANPYVSSVPSAVVTATLRGGVWALTDPYDSGLGAVVSVAPDFAFTRAAAAGLFYGAGAKYPIVTSDGAPRAPQFDLQLWLHDDLDYAMVEAMIEADVALLLRDPFGRANYVRLVGDAKWSQPLAAPSAAEIAAGYTTRFVHTVTLPLVSVARPLVTLPDPFADLKPG